MTSEQNHKLLTSDIECFFLGKKTPNKQRKKSPYFNKIKVHNTKEKYLAENFLLNVFGVRQFMKHIFKLGTLPAVNDNIF